MYCSILLFISNPHASATFCLKTILVWALKCEIGDAFGGGNASCKVSGSTLFCEAPCRIGIYLSAATVNCSSTSLDVVGCDKDVWETTLSDPIVGYEREEYAENVALSFLVSNSSLKNEESRLINGGAPIVILGLE